MKDDVENCVFKDGLGFSDITNVKAVNQQCAHSKMPILVVLECGRRCGQTL